MVLAEGDAVVMLHGLPHSATCNHSRHTRYSAFYRIRRFRPDNPYEGDPRFRHGASDMGDRLGDAGATTFDYEKYHPYRVTIDALCDQWADCALAVFAIVNSRLFCSLVGHHCTLDFV